MGQAFEFGALSALPLFPVLSREEMRAANGNELADIKDKQPQQVWTALMARLGTIPEYRRMFEAAYPGTRFAQMNFGYASNAIAGFLVDQFAFNNSPWDQFLAGHDDALTEVELRGAKDFMSARCSICHNGTTFSDSKFHNVAVAQIGPGRGDGLDGKDDFGRIRETGVAADRYAFRTPALRNVELTGPYGHDGAFTDLRAFVDHYSESDVKLHAFTSAGLEPLLQPTLLPTADAILATRDTLLRGVVFPAQTIDEVTAFMLALTDPAARDLSHVVPARVPSGLSVDH
jgi:cytochrome c peroxidase